MAIPSKHSVAVVEDDEAMRNAMRRVLEAEGFVTELFDSAEAFLASGAGSRAHCLVLDIQPGPADFWDAVRRLDRYLREPITGPGRAP